ncbi:hypothetical protein BGW80DRAFT_1251516 [Lactifluus volemus]|nr:hypothetical protein BGW80DRAFT_1251516 [Lactifluus volemus]
MNLYGVREFLPGGQRQDSSTWARPNQGWIVDHVFGTTVLCPVSGTSTRLGDLQFRLGDNIIAALEHPDRVQNWLSLRNIPHGGYPSPEVMVRGVSTLTRFTYLDIVINMTGSMTYLLSAASYDLCNVDLRDSLDRNIPPSDIHLIYSPLSHRAFARLIYNDTTSERTEFYATEPSPSSDAKKTPTIPATVAADAHHDPSGTITVHSLKLLIYTALSSPDKLSDSDRVMEGTATVTPPGGGGGGPAASLPNRSSCFGGWKFSQLETATYRTRATLAHPSFPLMLIMVALFWAGVSVPTLLHWQSCSKVPRLSKGKQVVGGLLPDSLTYNLEMGASSGEPERTPDEDEIEGEEARAVLGASSNIIADNTEKLATFVKSYGAKLRCNVV